MEKNRKRVGSNTRIMKKDESIIIVPYDSIWPEKFEKEKKLIQKTIGSWITGGIHHVGSTSIPGLSAKPIIDIMVGVDNLVKARDCLDLLSQIDYQYYPYKSEFMYWFCKPSPQLRTHHLHIIATSHPQYKARLAFRDYLRGHLKEKEEYEKLKINLSEKYRNDRELYTDAKTNFVKAIVTKALDSKQDVYTT